MPHAPLLADDLVRHGAFLRRIASALLRDPASVEDVVRSAVRLRVRASQSRAERAMRGMGVRPRAVEVRRRAATAFSPESVEKGEPG